MAGAVAVAMAVAVAVAMTVAVVVAVAVTVAVPVAVAVAVTVAVAVAVTVAVVVAVAVGRGSRPWPFSPVRPRTDVADLHTLWGCGRHDTWPGSTDKCSVAVSSRGHLCPWCGEGDSTGAGTGTR